MNCRNLASPIAMLVLVAGCAGSKPALGQGDLAQLSPRAELVTGDLSLKKLTPFFAPAPAYHGAEVNPEALAFVLCQSDAPLYAYLYEAKHGTSQFGQAKRDLAWAEALSGPDVEFDELVCNAAREISERVADRLERAREGFADRILQADAGGTGYSVLVGFNCCLASGSDSIWRARISESRRDRDLNDVSVAQSRAWVRVLIQPEFGWLVVNWFDMRGQQVHVWEFSDYPEAFDRAATTSFAQLQREGRPLHRFGVPSDERVWRADGD